MRLGVYSQYETALLGITNSWSRGEQMGKGSHAIYHQQNSVFNEIGGLMTSRTLGHILQKGSETSNLM